MDNLGSILKEAREAKELSKSQVANLMKVNRSTYGRWENGELDIPLKRLIELSKCLDLDIEKIIKEILK